MFSKSQLRFVNSLQHKKFRKQYGCFVVEGAKSVGEFINSDYEVQQLFSTEGAHAKLDKIPQNIKLIEVDPADMRKLSTLHSPQGLLALVSIPDSPGSSPDPALFEHGFTLVLDGVQDPGNLGTIIRTADWFGFDRLICGAGTVDVYSPKVVQASMGSLARLRVSYVDLDAFLSLVRIPVYGAVLEGKSIYETRFGSAGLVVLGNEGNGIQPSVAARIDHGITIPRIGKAESLNVAVTAAIFCSELARAK